MFAWVGLVAPQVIVSVSVSLGVNEITAREWESECELGFEYAYLTFKIYIESGGVGVCGPFFFLGT